LDNPSSQAPAGGGQRIFAWFLLILANLLWAGSYVAAKFALRDIPLNTVNSFRMIIAALVILPLFIARRKEFKLTRADLPQLALLALFGFVINKILEYGGLALTTASDVALLITSESIFTVLFAWLLLRERLRLVTVLSLLLGFAGVYLIVEQSLLPHIPAGGGAWRVVGDLLVLLALVFEAYYTVRGKSLLTRHSPLLITSAAIIGSTVFWIPVAGVQLVTSGWPVASLSAWLGLLWLALMSTVVSYLAWFKGLAVIDGSSAASVLFIQPLLGTILAVILLNEQLVPTTLVGGVLILVSVLVISRRESK
jgi:drug/metabolite transporter (DMT)-like permease